MRQWFQAKKRRFPVRNGLRCYLEHEVVLVLKLNERTEKLLNFIFPETSRGKAKVLIETMCGNNLPFCENYDSEKIERIRFSAIKVSNGQMDKLCNAIELAKTDWRDLLVLAGFENTEAHNNWYDNHFDVKSELVCHSCGGVVRNSIV